MSRTNWHSNWHSPPKEKECRRRHKLTLRDRTHTDRHTIACARTYTQAHAGEGGVAHVYMYMTTAQYPPENRQYASLHFAPFLGKLSLLALAGARKGPLDNYP